jgi:hypothetical protein
MHPTGMSGVDAERIERHTDPRVCMLSFDRDCLALLPPPTCERQCVAAPANVTMRSQQHWLFLPDSIADPVA